MLFEIDLNNIFVSSGKGNRNKNKQMEFYQTNKFLHSKINKRLPAKWEKRSTNNLSNKKIDIQ